MTSKFNLKQGIKKYYPLGFLFILIFGFVLIQEAKAKEISVGTASDNIGIGTNAPGTTYRLNVNGNSNITGNLNVTGNITGTSNLTGALSSGNVSAGTFGSNTGGGNYTFPGSLTFSSANPLLSSPSYFIIPGGAYFNGSTVYTESAIQARGGIHNDTGAYLLINGGTAGYNYFPGSIGIGATSPGAKLDVIASTPSGVGALPSGITALLQSSGNNLLGFNNSSDNGTWSGLIMNDNNQGGYIAFKNYPDDQMHIGGYSAVNIEVGSQTFGLKPIVATFLSSGSKIFGNLETTGTTNTPTLSINGNTVLTMPSNNPETGAWNPIWTSIGTGKPLCSDEEFASGIGCVSVYNNSGGDGVVITRLAGQTGVPNGTGVMLVITNNGNATSPGYGGFITNFTPSANRTYAQRFRAKLPVGRNLNIAENSQGSNSTSYWLTNTAGTGKWEDYIRVSHAGNTGTFSGGGHVYVAGGSSTFSWYLASANVYEVTSIPTNSILTTNATNVSAGTFGANTGGGNYSFPGNISVAGTGEFGQKLFLNAAEGLGVYGIRGRNANEQVEMYQKVSIGSPNGWNVFPQAPTFGLSVYGGANFATNQGSVGIGTTAPGYKLDVAGDIRAQGNIYTDSNYGKGLIGVYASTRLQGVYSMGDAYKLAADGTSAGNLYGLAWSHPNAGGVASNLNTHGLLVMENGTFLAAISGSIRARDDMQAPIFYDRNDPSYYVNPNSTSRLNSVVVGAISGKGAGLTAESNSNAIDANTLGDNFILYGGSTGSWVNRGPSGHNGGAILHIPTHPGGYYSDLWFDTANNRVYSRVVNGGGIGGWDQLARMSDIATVANADTVDGQHFAWDNRSNGPTYVWAADSNGSSYLAYRPALSVSYASTAGVADNVSTPTSGYKHLGAWAVGRTATGAILVNTAYRADYADSAGTAGSASSADQVTGTNVAFRVTAGDGNGLKFWNGSDSYKVSMGVGSLYQYGPVTDYSIKTQMDAGSTGRGFTWGREGVAPIAGLNSTSGNMQIAGQMTAAGFVYNSDVKLKKNITTIDNSLTKILQLRGVTFNWKKDNAPGVGLIAQEVEQVFPELVTESGGIKSVQYGNLVAPLIEAVKEQQKEIQIQTDRANAQQQEIENMKAQIQMLQAKN